MQSAPSKLAIETKKWCPLGIAKVNLKGADRGIAVGSMISTVNHPEAYPGSI
jgi:hypothetical protein